MRQRLEVGGARPRFFSTSAPTPPPLSLRSVFGGTARGSFRGGYGWEEKELEGEGCLVHEQRQKQQLFFPLCLIIKNISSSF